MKTITSERGKKRKGGKEKKSSGLGEALSGGDSKEKVVHIGREVSLLETLESDGSVSGLIFDLKCQKFVEEFTCLL